MLIPAAISLLVSTLVLNLGLSFNAPAPVNAVQAEGGRVLGVVEYNAPGIIGVESGGNFNQAVIRVIEGAMSLPLPRLPQPPALDQPLSQLPENQDKTAPAAVDFDLDAANGVVFDLSGDNLFFSQRPDRPWPIASITKLFTAYTFLDFNPGWDTPYTIKAEDRREGGKIYLFNGDTVTIKDLFYFSLVGSDNTATAALVHAAGFSESEFARKMNDKIKELGLKNTRFADVTGLTENNVSTAREVARFAKIALDVPDINLATLTKQYEFVTGQGKRKIINSTDRLLDVFPENGIAITGGKTGFINASGYCLVSRFKNDDGQEIITVVLGADSEAGRFNATKQLVELYYGGGQ
ncbi:MAG: serine hydrolase [bacterium]|nr:serine hydrolase [bacterium]